MKSEKTVQIIKPIMQWELIYSYKFVELWKTPTMFLVCYKYGRVFVFCKTLDEAKEKVYSVYEDCLKRLKVQY